MTANARLDIAITDRNPHVREFLCRELSELGHAAKAFTSAMSLLEVLHGPNPPQVIVLDPEVSGAGMSEVGRRLRSHPGKVTVVLHVFEGAEPQPEFDGALVVEKRPDMGPLKAVLKTMAAQLPRLPIAEDAPGLRRPQEKP